MFRQMRRFKTERIVSEFRIMMQQEEDENTGPPEKVITGCKK